MRLRLPLLNLALRLFAKPALARMKGPEEMRRHFERNAQRFFRPPEGAEFAETRIRRPDGEALAALWCSRGAADPDAVVLYLHGGAYLAGSMNTHRHLGAALAGAAGARLLLPDYRLAPEHQFPAALDDAFAVYLHLLESGHDPGAIALAGDSAGGGLVFALLLRLASEGQAMPACAVGFSPWVDLTGKAASLRRNERRDVMLPAGRLHEVVGHYVGSSHDPADPLASPVFGEWHNPPPALIMASRSEILVDDAISLAEALRQGGGDVQLELWRGQPHAWPTFAGLLPDADRAVDQAGAFIATEIARSCLKS